jgi:hypothetical protein
MAAGGKEFMMALICGNEENEHPQSEAEAAPLLLLGDRATSMSQENGTRY